MPQEMMEFYRLCGGGTLFFNSTRPIEILKPSEVIPANLVILGEEAYEELLLKEENDISMKWYVVARYDETEYVTIDFDQDRCGRCYDSFHETHAVAGSCEIIALTFSEFLSNLLETMTKTSDSLCRKNTILFNPLVDTIFVVYVASHFVPLGSETS
ncbi:SMI1/KNR4 family protein [Paenibacillus rhizophilus]|uniref:SMI1/KNR4 family protein n=1 Tax=Paenibacillus rhizophilus TaxID=1850366 RepID=UPI00248305A5|nr:SMI1/KNR4 family protein [Paenibacillus rhizophilus]